MNKISFLKAPFKNFYTALFVCLLLYSLAFGLFFVRAGDIQDSKSLQDSTVVEAVLLPPGIQGSSLTVDPLRTARNLTDSVSEIQNNINSLVFSSLFKESTTGDLQKDLVKDFKFENSRNLLLSINPNAFWHDGTNVTAEDIIFTFNQIKQDSLYYGAVNEGDISFKLIDKYSIQIDLTGSNGDKPNSAYLQELVFPIPPKHLLEDFSQKDLSQLSLSEFSRKPVGSGILILDQNTGSEIQFTKNPNYHNSKLNFERFTLKFYQNVNDIKKDFVLRNVDLYTRKNFLSNTFAFESDRVLLNKSFLQDRNYVLYFNLGSGGQATPFSRSISLRNGLQKILDRKKLVEALEGNAQVVYGPIDQSSWAHWPEEEKELETNPDEWKKRAEGAGYALKEGFYQKENTKLAFSLSYLSNEVSERIVSKIKEEMALSGVEVTLNAIGKTDDNSASNSGAAAEQFNDIILNRRFAALLTQVSHYQDPDRFAQWHSSKTDQTGLNFSGLDNNVIDLMLSQGRSEPDKGVRKERYIRFQKIFHQEAPALYLIHPAIISYSSKSLKNTSAENINNIEYRYGNIADWKRED